VSVDEGEGVDMITCVRVVSCRGAKGEPSTPLNRGYLNCHIRRVEVRSPLKRAVKRCSTCDNGPNWLEYLELFVGG
jgi:hypothetical protein